jgi:putative transposase
MKKLSILSYHELEQYDIPSYYKLCAISKAAGILANRKQSIKRGVETKNPYLKKALLISCYGFKIENNIMKIPLGNIQYFDIPLNDHTKQILSDPTLKVRSFVLNASNTLGVTISKDITELECTGTVGIDRNLRNVTAGNCEHATQYDLSKTIRIAGITKSIYSSFKRNDDRIRKQIYSKYGTRRKKRIVQMLHNVSKDIVKNAVKNRSAIVFEDIRNIRKLYQKGNGQGRKFRSKMNGWPFAEIKRQIEYKAKWNGVPIIQLSKSETRGTSSLCPKYGKRLQDSRTNKMPNHDRELWCKICQRWLDRDVVAVMNQSLRGWVRFAHSKEGVACETMKWNQERDPVILRVDASKLSGHLTK